MTDPIKTDVVIVGGGMIGLCTALGLGRAGLRVCVVERLPLDVTTAGDFDGRVTAIAHASVNMLRGIGAWSFLAPHAEPIRQIRVSDGDAPLFLHFDHLELGPEPFGHMVENRYIRLGLLQALAETDVQLLSPAQLADFQRTASGVTVTLADGSILTAPLLIAADGRMSPIREKLGIHCVRSDYHQTAIVTTLSHERPHDGIAHEKFMPAGPFALLPMQGNRSALVWTESTDAAPSFLALSDEDFDTEIAKRVGGFLGDVKHDGQRFSYPLKLHLAQRYVDDRVVLLGDAAHGIHPIAGQGLNLGFRDVAALIEVVVDAARLGLDHGGATTLDRYAGWRHVDVVTLAAVTDGLNRLFANHSTTLRVARDVGLAAVNRMGPVKRFFMRQAEGMGGKMPRLLRGETL